MPSCTALEDCRLPSDDDNTDDEESDSEADLEFDEYTVSESESDNEWTYFLHWTMHHVSTRMIVKRSDFPIF